MDIEEVKTLAELMQANELTRIEIREGDTHVLLTRARPGVAVSVPAAAPVVSAAPAAVAAAPVIAAPAKPAGADDNGEVLIRSPMVGTFYASPDPESPPFVRVGDTVGPESVVCLVEAMKVFNEIKAEVSGRVTKALVKSSEAVEFDQPLFAVQPL
ncbi:MAG: acetyl-CoA carboxylase biotin carboxyl carrier protein [Phycisphaerae bacterium]|nr:acetyl-CoA carboxylase biotin carboxyl carrier protein [Phycisphaerae bacterium]MCZ2401277.1 acetyl-CoA carboxylase biotin carboxyl carrier protein [Phycisphaerae bacterium]